ncbi:hypothetical protein LXA43DRAFT_107872 [Ganoderma leucocontextum]|nr:hypothetical protein LXA43DRAFT_107872 [Ganoderma leucocontextum]
MAESPDCTNERGKVTRSLQHATRRAAPPFDTVDADIIVRSSDRIDFFVHSIILSMGSAFSRVAFQLQDALPSLVHVAEDSDTLGTFLRILYPLVDPEVNSLSHLRNVLAAGVKYDAPIVVASMRKALVGPRFLEADPVRVFAIACFCQLEEEARVAARRAVVLDRVSGLRPEQCPELNDVSAGAYFRLLQLNRTRTTFPPLNKWFSIVADDTHVSFFGIEPFCTGRLTHPPVKSAATSTPSSSASSEADFVSCTSEPQSAPSPQEDYQGEVGPSQPVAQGIHTVVNVSLPKKSDVKAFPEALPTDRRLAMGQFALASAWSNITDKKPLLFYFFAVENGWREEALACARQLVQEHNSRDLSTLYVSKMETVGSLPYRRLLAYAQACRTAASADFELRDLPARRCPAWSRCHARYPPTLTTASPPKWLKAHFKAAQDALRDRPCRAQVLPGSLDSPFVVSFQASVIADRPPCTQGSETTSAPSPFDGKIPTMWQCTAEDNVRWAVTVLQQYVAAVDRAVEQVVLAIA